MPVALQAPRDLQLACLHARIAKLSQFMRIAFTGQNRLDDRLSRHSAHVSEHIGQLDIHLRQRLLHPLNVPPGRLHQIIALPPVRSHLANFLRRPERIAQQPIGMQLHQPLTLLHVAFAPWQIFVSRAFTKYTSKSAASRMSYTAI